MQSASSFVLTELKIEVAYTTAGEWNAGPKIAEWLGNGTSDGQDENNDLRYHANCCLVVKDSSWHCLKNCLAAMARLQDFIRSVKRTGIAAGEWNAGPRIVK